VCRVYKRPERGHDAKVGPNDGPRAVVAAPWSHSPGHGSQQTDAVRGFFRGMD